MTSLMCIWVFKQPPKLVKTQIWTGKNSKHFKLLKYLLDVQICNYFVNNSINKTLLTIFFLNNCIFKCRIIFHIVIPSSSTFSNMWLSNKNFLIFQHYIKKGFFSGKLAMFVLVLIFNEWHKCAASPLLVWKQWEKYRRKKVKVCLLKKFHSEHKQFCWKFYSSLECHFLKCVEGCSFYNLSDLQVVSALCTSGRTVYSSCQFHAACGLQEKKARFGLVWCDFIWLGFLIRYHH